MLTSIYLGNTPTRITLEAVLIQRSNKGLLLQFSKSLLSNITFCPTTGDELTNIGLSLKEENDFTVLVNSSATVNNHFLDSQLIPDFSEKKDE